MSKRIARQLWFTQPFAVAIRNQPLAILAPGELLVETELSAVSAGTELLLYRGQMPTDMALDLNIDSLQKTPKFPLQYGYASVGKVIEVADDLDNQWLGKRVFAFQPHASHFIATPAQVIPVPADINATAAIFLANMETAINLVQDGKPSLGEQVVVLGQGIVGLLLSAILALYPLAKLHAADAIAKRRQQSLALGATDVFDPHSQDDIQRIKQHLSTQASMGADLIYEVSGNPEALNLAIGLGGFNSRIVIGSWYGNKSAPIALGGDAHRNQLKISTSQVSNIAPELTGRWNKARRFDLAWELIRQLKPEQLITHEFALAEASELYKALDQNNGDIVQAVLTYNPI